MTGGRMNPGLITEMPDVLDRHGYGRGDNEHTARAIVLISDLAHIYEGSLDHPFGPSIGETPPRTERPAPEPAGRPGHRPDCGRWGQDRPGRPGHRRRLPA
jgi:hypothetical protein